MEAGKDAEKGLVQETDKGKDVLRCLLVLLPLALQALRGAGRGCCIVGRVLLVAARPALVAEARVRIVLGRHGILIPGHGVICMQPDEIWMIEGGL